MYSFKISFEQWSTCFEYIFNDCVRPFGGLRMYLMTTKNITLDSRYHALENNTMLNTTRKRESSNFDLIMNSEKRPIPRPYGQVMGRLFWVLWENDTVRYRECTVFALPPFHLHSSLQNRMQNKHGKPYVALCDISCSEKRASLHISTKDYQLRFYKYRCDASV